MEQDPARDERIDDVRQKEVWQAIERAGLPPTAFKFVDRPGGRNATWLVCQLEYKESPYYYLFDATEHGHYAEFNPGWDVRTQYENPGDWGAQMGYVECWLNRLKMNVETVNPWELAGQGAAMDKALPWDELERPFTKNEREQIAREIDDVKERLARVEGILPDRLEDVRGQLDYLVREAEVTKVRTWLYAVAGVCTSAAVALATQPDVAREVYRIIAMAADSVFGGTLSLPFP